MHHQPAKPWSITWIAQHIASGFLLAGAVLAAAVALTILIIVLEEVIALIAVHRPINTYTNVYGNAILTVIWHFIIVFSLVAYWSALDTFVDQEKDIEK